MTIKGKEIVYVRKMTDEEKEREGWEHEQRDIPVIELEDGQLIYPSQDSEGNGPGELFGYDPELEDGDGSSFGFDLSYHDRFESAAEDQGFTEPLRESPNDVPAGWTGGKVEQTGGFILCRIWRTEGWNDESNEEYFEAIYGSNPSVSIHRYEHDGDSQRYSGEVCTRFADENTDEEKAEMAKDMMEKFDSKEYDDA